ncbi:alpha/beta hydrolase-fold protein [Actinoplanes sp. NPDC051470]|uniref:alpha/beta hydrolase n=1 Tax=Actinoplanes sp. NPDC051470 TaxID=3157224 RepID=UPI0034250F00
MEPGAGAWCRGPEVCFRLLDQDQRLAGVRLGSGAFPRGADLTFAYDPADHAWELRRPRPPVRRLEYKLELTHPEGRTEWVCDPDNPLRVGGGFGDSSELRCDDYREPAWLTLPQVHGAWRDVYLPLPAVRGEMVAQVWSPDASTGRVVIAHDGPDYHRFGELGRYAAAMIGAGQVPPFHLVLLPPGERFEWYSASPAYARALARDALPKLAAELGADRPVVGIGASLGGLAMLHAQRRHPAAFGGLFLQSASLFQPRFDRQESGFGRYLRIVRFTGRVRRRPDGPAVPITLTCGAVEENLANNKDMAAVLSGHGYDVSFDEVPDAHTWIGWRDALDPYLTTLLQKVF